MIKTDMQFEIRQPKLKDKLYGEMVWDEWDYDESYWYKRIKDEKAGEFDLLIAAKSQADFLAVALTHSTYKKLLENITAIRDQTVAYVMENAAELFRKKRDIKFAARKISRKQRLFCIQINIDLSSKIQFVENYEEDEYPEDYFYAEIDNKGNFVRGGLDKF